MKVTLISNGKKQIVLIPEDDFDRAMLKAFGKQDLEATEISQTTQIVNTSISEGLIISTNTKKDELNNE